MNPFRSWLGTLNFLVVQWFFVRLQEVGHYDDMQWVHERWELLRWVVPVTGWWNKYLFIGKHR